MQNHGVQIFTDGACSQNPGPGGYGAIVVRNGERTELSGGFRRTTNNRMEILAAIEGLASLDAAVPAEVTVFSDSRYVVDMFTKGHAARWRSRGWMRTPRDPALNPDLWERLLDLAAAHQTRFEWVKGHNNHDENERCDALAVAARQQADLPADDGYETANAPAPPVAQQTAFDF